MRLAAAFTSFIFVCCYIAKVVCKVTCFLVETCYCLTGTAEQLYNEQELQEPNKTQPPFESHYTQTTRIN